MSGPRKLWTGPYGAMLRDRAIERSSGEASGLWLVPSPMAREQVSRELAIRSTGAEPPRVWCWDDAWAATARAHPDPPARPSTTGLAVVLSEAIERCRRAGSLVVLGRAVEFPGYRRQLLGRFAAWTAEERALDLPATGDSPAAFEEWALFGHYRETLRQVGAEDPAGFAVWASRAMVQSPPPELRRPGQVVVLDPVEPCRAGWRLLDWCHRKARSMTVVLPFDADPALADLYAPADPTRRQLLGWGFVEEPDRVDGFRFRPAGPDAIERDLFRSDAHERPRLRLGPGDGLKILGGPRGEGVGLLVAREVAAHVRQGVEPEEILVLVPRLDEDAERIREALASWGLPVARRGPGRLSTVPAVSALRLAARLPADRWEASTLVRLLRNGQVRWAGGELASAFGPAEAASAIRSTRAFRDRETLRRALLGTLDREPRHRPARAALEAIERLSGLIDPVARPGPWSSQVGRLRRLADGLGLDPPGLDPLWDALEDHAWALARLGPAIAEEALSWEEFVGRVDAIVDEAWAAPPPPDPGTIRVEPVDAAEGARARVVVLANLAERTFPSTEAIDPDPDPSSPESAARANLAYSREMLRFARVAGSADDRLILAYPMTDLSGEALLPAGFLDDLARRLGDPARRAIVEAHARFDPVLEGHEELARSPADARVRAVALACRGEDGPLRALAARAGQAEALAGTADAFVVARHRTEDRSFGPYDGRLVDDRAVDRIRLAFGPAHAFSPSQLESFAFCPFQFFQRYVLGLKLVDERHELDEDYVGRGSHVHDVLERIHQQVAAEGESHVIDRLGVLIETDMRAELERHDGAEADVAQVLREIATRRTNKALGRYLAQFRAYARSDGEEPDPHRFEVLFGQPDREHSLPHLAIGRDGDAVLLQGKIDRIDLVRKDGRDHFRVIDYKTGSCPSPADVKSGLASQLTLYAMAVEQLVFPSGEAELVDVGYWSLPKDGFKGVKLGDWADHRDRLAAFIVGLVAELRGGMFAIDSRKKECKKSCDFRSTCRVAEVRVAGKVREGRPSMERDS